MKKPLVSIIMGSENDLPVMNTAAQTLEDFKIPYDIQVVSAHRTPDWMFTFAKTAEAKGTQIIIAGAGGAAHLPGMVASMTPLPVIGVPVMTSKLNGMDSLLSIVQMPKGVPVATVAVDNGTNAALLALRILSLNSKKLAVELKKFSENQTKKALKSNKTLTAKKKDLDKLRKSGK
jgi:phosphoribosylaminoimidazole carboxylase PurE protein